MRITCEYPGCTNDRIVTCCKLGYNTTAYYCPEHAEELGYCRSCGFKFPLKNGICKGCRRMQHEAQEGGWID